jgi:Uma2 family endonuclease
MDQAAVIHFEGDLHLPEAALTHAGFREWVKSAEIPEGVRASYAGGEVFLEMSPESLHSHAKVKLEVSVVVAPLVRALGLGETYPDGTLLTNQRAELSTEPDLVVVTWEAWESGRVVATPKTNRADDAIELVGTPDLVVEIVSDSSVRKDLIALRERYARAGIPEYWIIDARADAIRFEILLLGEDGYAPMAPSGQPQPGPLLDRTFELTRAKSRIGTWTYTLSTAP